MCVSKDIDGVEISFRFPASYPLELRQASSRRFDRFIEGVRSLASPWVDILEQPTAEASKRLFVENKTLIKTQCRSILSHLVHAFGFRLIEGHVIEAVK